MVSAGYATGSNRYPDQNGPLTAVGGTGAINGFNNSVQATSKFDVILKFIRNQGDKAGRSGRGDVADYWSALEQEMQALKEPAQAMAREVGLAIPEKGIDRTLNPLYLLLAREWAQHMVTHSIFITS